MPEARRRHLLLVAPLAGVTALAVVVVPVILATIGLWAVSAGASNDVTPSVRVAVDLWLLALRVPVVTGAGTLLLSPLTLTCLFVVAFYIAGRRVGRDALPESLQAATAAAAVMAVTVGCVTAAAAAAVRAVSGGAHLALALTLPALWCLLACVIGVIRGADLAIDLRHRLGALPRLSIAPMVTSATMLVAAGLAMVIGSEIFHVGRFLALWHAIAPAGSDSVGVVLLHLILVPNAALWAVAFIVGPGFAVGSGTHVSIMGAHVGALPALPAFAALPSGSSVGELGAVLLLVPVLCGAVLGSMLAARTRHLGFGRQERALAAAACSAIVALAIGLACALSGGAVGPGRMVAVGPSAWRVALVLVLELAVGALPAAAFPPAR